ncbi:MAG: mechanosensitive ion channel family protein [Bacteroidia bacterium]|nr:mechanosensitive ion channel family protein [Bacteroidia bacterium]MBT8279714.1 mechanosensitive ion channel family protein [Bacteroidia bacterium]NND26716.1 mechanosensitive ion channel family protein [Flavobacteriaceae bacterium]NNL32645.1 mechanosensitive ion channel family protein [Flavobacteriaceae bacterium]
MEIVENISQWMNEHPTSSSIIKYLVWAVFILLTIAFLRKLLRKKLPDSAVRYKSQKAVEILGYILLVIITISYFTGSIKDFALAIGLLTAGITITLQELILSIAGSFYIFFVGVYKPGDRIEINNIKGDVIDIDSIYTTMMEIGEWVSSDNYSGRIVKLSNAFVFKGPVYNYSKDFPFVWDEFNLPIKYGSDVELAKSIIIEIASKTLSDFVSNSISQWNQVVNKYYIENAQVDPTLAITMTDNWIQFNLRYIVDYKKRRHTKHILNELIGKEIEKTKGKVQLASATIEIVRIPNINVKKE